MLTIAKTRRHQRQQRGSVAPHAGGLEQHSRPCRGADAFDFNLYPTGWRLNKNGYGVRQTRPTRGVPLNGSSAEDVASDNVKATSNYWFNDNLDAGNPAVGIRCVKNYKVKK